MKIGFIDCMILKYNGNTLNEKGLGGSESAIVLLTKELAKIGFDVTVFNTLDGDEAVYDGVLYKDIKTLNKDYKEHFDILVSSRCTIPFIRDKDINYVKSKYGLDYTDFSGLTYDYSVIWMHDTFCHGDEYLQEVLATTVDKLFTLSDWHATYVSTAMHENNQRFPEFFKSKIFNTRNGAVNYHNEVNINEKDKMLFVYNSSVNKGMQPLLDIVWPLVNARYPEAKLKVIGGYYNFKDEDPNSFENQYKKLKEKYDGNFNIEFTGIIKQKEIADILTKASYMLYPSIYPETFGISVTEATLYNVVNIGFNFGALEETVHKYTSYNTEFNLTFPDINKQVESLFHNIVMAVEDTLQTYNKMYMCNGLKPFLGWDVVALQWKNHFYYNLGKFMPIKETIKHRYNMGNLHKLYSKVHVNPEEYTEDYSYYKKNRIVVISPMYNGEKYISKCIESVASQVYDNYEMFIISDMSTDNSFKVANDTIEELDEDIRDKFAVISNTRKANALSNQCFILDNFVKKDDIVILLDGDDYLNFNPDIFNYINREYEQNKVKFTYGSSYSLADKIYLIGQEYPKEVKKNKTYRKHRFPWNMPYTHLRTFKGELYFKLDNEKLLDKNGDYYGAGGDNALFYGLIELCEPDEVKAINKILCIYNDINPLNDFRVNGIEQNKNAEEILNDA